MAFNPLTAELHRLGDHTLISLSDSIVKEVRTADKFATQRRKELSYVSPATPTATSELSNINKYKEINLGNIIATFHYAVLF